MDKEKVVVVLLLITIILSIVSVVMTFSVDAGSSNSGDGITNTENDQGVGHVAFEIVEASTGDTG